VTQEFLRKARARTELTSLSSTFRANTQQLRAERRSRQGHAARRPVEDVYSAIQAQFGSLTGKPVQPVQPRVVGDRPVRAKYRQDPAT
jgi:hypothetical protein